MYHVARSSLANIIGKQLGDRCFSAASTTSLRVAVVGAGPGGLVAALSLHKLLPGIRVDVIESCKELDSGLGGGVNIAGGAAVLDRLDLGDVLWESAPEASALCNPLTSVVARNHKGKQLYRIDVPASVRTHGADSGLLTSDGRVFSFNVMRGELQAALVKRLPDDVPLRLGQRVLAVKETPNATQVQYTDGTEEEFDLVIGADGINSLVRRAFLGKKEAKEFMNMRMVHAVGFEGVDLRERPQESHLWFCPASFVQSFTAGTGTKRRDVLTFVMSEPGSGHSWVFGENADWECTEDDRAGNNDLRAQLVKDLYRLRFPRELHEQAFQCESIYEFGVYYHNPLETWHSKHSRIVLIGDAAHASPLYLGQGVNQAMQDAYCLADRLARTQKDLPQAILEYEECRLSATTNITDSGWALGMMQTQEPPYAALRDMGFRIGGVLGLMDRAFVKAARLRV